MSSGGRTIEEWDIEIDRLRAALSEAKRARHTLVRSLGMRARHTDPHFKETMDAVRRKPWPAGRKPAGAAVSPFPVLTNAQRLHYRKLKAHGLSRQDALTEVFRAATQVARPGRSAPNGAPAPVGLPTQSADRRPPLSPVR